MGDEGGREIELVLWTVAGDGLHFDALLPEGLGDGTVSDFGRLNFDELMEAASHAECSGEANNQTTSSGTRHRLYCPVPGCPKGRKTEAAGCMAPKTLRDHLSEHALGRFPGAVPESWLQENQSSICPVCTMIINNRFGGVCPKCRPKRRAEQTQETEGRPLPNGCHLGTK